MLNQNQFIVSTTANKIYGVIFSPFLQSLADRTCLNKLMKRKARNDSHLSGLLIFGGFFAGTEGKGTYRRNSLLVRGSRHLSCWFPNFRHWFIEVKVR